MASRKRHSTEDFARGLCRAGELPAEGKTGEETAGELGVSLATLYKSRPLRRDGYRRQELKGLGEQNAPLGWLLAEAG